jgi:hypothetical protein
MRYEPNILRKKYTCATSREIVSFAEHPSVYVPAQKFSQFKIRTFNFFSSLNFVTPLFLCTVQVHLYRLGENQCFEFLTIYRG